MHRCVNHKAREFSRKERIFGDEIEEGFFGCLKSYFRVQGKKVSKRNICPRVIWRQYLSVRNLDPFSDLLVRIQEWQKGNPNRLGTLLVEKHPQTHPQEEMTMWTKERNSPRDPCPPPQPHSQLLQEEVEGERTFWEMPSSQLFHFFVWPIS